MTQESKTGRSELLLWPELIVESLFLNHPLSLRPSQEGQPYPFNRMVLYPKVSVQDLKQNAEEVDFIHELCRFLILGLGTLTR